MNEEEKQAIEYWKTHIEILHCNTQIASEHYIKVLLDLVEKQQKEIEGLKFKYQARKDRTKVIIEELQEELEENENKYDDFTTAYLQGVYDGKKNLKYKIKELIEEKAKTDTYNFKTIAVKDIEELLGE